MNGTASAVTEVAYLTRALKMPRARQTAEPLAEAARNEGWDYLEYLARVLGDEGPCREVPSNQDPRRL